MRRDRRDEVGKGPSAGTWKYGFVREDWVVPVPVHSRLAKAHTAGKERVRCGALLDIVLDHRICERSQSGGGRGPKGCELQIGGR